MSGPGGTMRALMLRGARDVALLDVPRPAPGPGEVLLRVSVALTCGTDAKVFRRGYHARMLTPPCLFGHEYAGVVEEVGAGVTRFSPGQAVVGANSAPCGVCRPCGRGRESLCEDLLFVNGAFAEWLLLPARLVARNLHPLPDGLDARHAAAVDPVACVLKGVETADPPAGSSGLILGAGPVAVFLAQELVARGVDCAVVAINEDSASLVRRGGAGQVIVVRSVSAALEDLRALSEEGRGFDLVVEAAGSAETASAAVELAAPGGSVLLFGGCAAQDRVTLSPARLHYDEIALLSSFHHTPRHVEAALAAMASGRIRVGPTLEATTDLAGLPAALAALGDRSLLGKVPVVPGP